MAEREMNEDVNEESLKNDEDNLETNSSSSSVLAGLNLVLILSSLSSSDEQSLTVEEIEERESTGKKGKNSGSRSDFPTRRQQASGYNRAIDKQQMSRIQTKMRDYRHCRRL